MMGFDRMVGSFGKGLESTLLKKGEVWWMVTSDGCELCVNPQSA
jgi:hypothetical protein